MYGEVNESASDVCHDQSEPQSRNFREKKITNHATDECRRFNRGDPSKRGCAAKSCADQKTAERETFRNLVDAQSSEQRPLCSTAGRCFALDSQSQTVCRTMNCQ